MIAYYRPLLYASAWQLGSWLLGLLLAMRLWPEGAAGVFWGGLVMAVNFSLLRFVAHLWHRDQGPSRSVVLLISGKLIALLALTSAILYWAEPHPGGLLAGLCSLFFGVLGATLHRRPRARPDSAPLRHPRSLPRGT